MPKSSNNPALSVISVRMPTDLRDSLTEKCKQEDVALAQFIRDCAEAYIEDRLRILPAKGGKPSYFEEST